MGSLELVFILLLIYQAKHFLADYPLQGRYMLGKFKPGWDFLLPLATHCAVHAWMTLCIVFFIVGRSDLWWLALVDFGVHFIMDRLKAGPKYLGRFKALSGKEMQGILSYLPTLGEDGVRELFGSELKGNTFFWWSLGIDQMVHHLTHYYLIYKMVT